MLFLFVIWVLDRGLFQILKYIFFKDYMWINQLSLYTVFDVSPFVNIIFALFGYIFMILMLQIFQMFLCVIKAISWHGAVIFST